MELRHLRYFIAVAEELHFAHAAERLDISGPTLSNQISALESELRVQLFNRKTKKNVTLTNAGTRFLEEARATIRQAEFAEHVGRQAGLGEAGTITIGYVLTAALMGLLPSAIASFRKSHPNVTFAVRRTETFPTMKDILSRQTDIGIIRRPERYPSGLSGFTIVSDDFCVALPQSHPLASRKQVTPSMLSNDNFIATPLEMEVGFWGNISGNVGHRVVARATDIISVLSLVAGGIGVSVLPAPARNAGIPGVVFLNLIGRRKADYALVHRKNEASPLIKLFIQSFRTKKYMADTLR
jgi:DNA-binding transcriptional LysR family regulator